MNSMFTDKRQIKYFQGNPELEIHYEFIVYDMYDKQLACGSAYVDMDRCCQRILQVSSNRLPHELSPSCWRIGLDKVCRDHQTVHS